MDVDQTLGAHQQCIDMIRRAAPHMSDTCDTWERRLYSWHDVVLKVMAVAVSADPQATEFELTLNPEETGVFKDYFRLKEELVLAGDALFRT